MTITDTYVRAVVGGQISSSDDWSTGYVLGFGAFGETGTDSELSDIATTILAAFKSHVWDPSANKLTAQNNTGATLESCKTYQYVEGVLVAQGSASITPDPGLNSTGGPAYVALCVSEYTAKAGRSGRGRSYLPFTASNIDAATGLFSDISAVATNVFAYYNALVADYTIGGTSTLGVPSVISRKLSQVNAITQIRINSLPDTQRGRISSSPTGTIYSGAVT